MLGQFTENRDPTLQLYHCSRSSHKSVTVRGGGTDSTWLIIKIYLSPGPTTRQLHGTFDASFGHETQWLPNVADIWHNLAPWCVYSVQASSSSIVRQRFDVIDPGNVGENCTKLHYLRALPKERSSNRVQRRFVSRVGGVSRFFHVCTFDDNPRSFRFESIGFFFNIVGFKNFRNDNWWTILARDVSFRLSIISRGIFLWWNTRNYGIARMGSLETSIDFWNEWGGNLRH